MLALAAAVERDSDHPIARAVVDAARGPLPTARDVRDVPGTGVDGTVEGQSVAVRRLELEDLTRATASSIDHAVDERQRRGETVVAVWCDDEVIGAIAVATPLRPEAADAVATLHRLELRTAVLSGDTEPAVRVAAAELGIDQAAGALSPADKVAELRTLRAADHRVVMVGDGVNDAPALAAADVGCTVGSGSDAALANSDVALLGNDLRGVPSAISVARSTYSVIVQNFGWAMGYNPPPSPWPPSGSSTLSSPRWPWVSRACSWWPTACDSPGWAGAGTGDGRPYPP